MSRTGETAANRPQPDVFSGHLDTLRAHQEILRGLDGKAVCPFCGSVSEKSAGPCARCSMENTPEARKATKARIGPWYVLQARNPAAPGMRFETLLSFVRKGRVRARSVVRGPTTHQLWRFAAHVKGLSREFGLCFSCGSPVETTANICPQCNRLQEPPINPDVLLEDGSEDAGASAASRPVLRELPEPPAAARSAPSVHEPEPEHDHEPHGDDADIVIPALGGFGIDDTAPVAATTPPPQFSDAPVAPASRPGSRPQAQQQQQPRPAAGAPAPAPQGDNPFAIAPPRKKGNGDATFLSAKELAAAFKLSFDPGADMDAVNVPDELPAGALPDGMRPGSLGRGPAVQFSPAASAPGSLARQSAADSPARPRKRGGGFRKFVLFVFILAGTGFGVLMWVDPASRERTVQWTKSTYAKVHAYLAQRMASQPGGAAGGADPFDVPPPTTLPTDKEDAPASPETKEAVQTPDSAEEAAASEPSAKVEAEEPPAPARPVVSPESRPKASPSPRPAPAVPTRRATPEADERVPANEPTARPASEEDSFARMESLRLEASAAEGARDYALALRKWQEIQKLPKSAHPGNLDLQIKRLRNLVNSNKK